jgi:hypothetical protein
MLYQLVPPNRVLWCAFPGSHLRVVTETGDDLSRLPWELAEDRAFSSGLLAIALRHGVAARGGIVLDALYAVDLGRSDELRFRNLVADESHARLRESSGAPIEAIFPGWKAHLDELDRGIQASTERASQQADEGLSLVMGAPAKSELEALWVSLGGQVPG